MERESRCAAISSFSSRAEGAESLASTPLCPTQGFSMGPHILALQFHPEVDVAAGIERWLTGHAAELASAGIDPRAMRAEAARTGPELANAARDMLAEWLAGLDLTTRGA